MEAKSSLDTCQGILVVPYKAEQLDKPPSETIFATTSSLTGPRCELEVRTWLDSPISAALGIPLKVTNFPSDNSKLQNKLAIPLFLNVDPEDDAFAKVSYRYMDGGVLLARQDGEKLDEKHVVALLAYLNSLSEVMVEHARKEWEGDEERKEQAKVLAEERLTPYAFMAFFGEYQASMTRACEPGWEKVNAPI
ncbi:hypothetical protein BAUCODRAFT_187485 [Baudoinia panamericana UAMH 10762]|uniref:Uncharacterized protein n=1 Tax=Baudoinia panamericana (strain UAMH 10762) TaxID=717646 RepID=M2NMX6_BAUPA|nr:uncharacterized protein BAUCODRAFT_187485 [Baudoinia panamericana UAMH 10762]EMD00885.1 hypothetical protein BAUCODRAFT_187485 [Baudoinia panamericana UAMH 10762]